MKTSSIPTIIIKRPTSQTSLLRTSIRASSTTTSFRKNGHQQQQQYNRHQNHQRYNNDNGPDFSSKPKRFNFASPNNRHVQHLNPTAIARSSVTIFQSPLLSVQYCSAILLLRAFSVLMNPFHPLLRPALINHEETYDIGYFFHLHTSSKLFTGREAVVRRSIRGKVRAAWTQIMQEKGYDPNTGRFVGHLQKGWDPTTQVRQQDVKGTVSLLPGAACNTAPFTDILRDCERGLEAVRKCKVRNQYMEDMMRPANLFRYYDWRRRLLLKKYTELGYGLSINGQSATRFKQAIRDLRGEAGKAMTGPDGEYLLDIDGETYDIGRLKRKQGRKKPGFLVPGEVGEVSEGGKVEEAEDTVVDEEMEKMYGAINLEDMQGGSEGKGGLDWDLDDLDLDDDVKPTMGLGRVKEREKAKVKSWGQQTYSDGF
ncbi:hypothetical protein ABW19_dt0204321 [Dactylella cylindrospora]|nr:hypothetical protein ABW19_dt0204321 [Dactylella cylindrospora]